MRWNFRCVYYFLCITSTSCCNFPPNTQTQLTSDSVLVTSCRRKNSATPCLRHGNRYFNGPHVSVFISFRRPKIAKHWHSSLSNHQQQFNSYKRAPNNCIASFCCYCYAFYVNHKDNSEEFNTYRWVLKITITCWR